jgi:hypothetical protein
MWSHYTEVEIAWSKDSSEAWLQVVKVCGSLCLRSHLLYFQARQWNLQLSAAC